LVSSVALFFTWIARRTAPFAAAGIVLVALRPATAGASEDKTNFRESVFVCEEALGKLEDCCPGFDPSRVRCAFYEFEESGCEGYRAEKTEHPALDVDESRCILAKECNDLVERGTCARAQAAAPERRTYDSPGRPGESPSGTTETQPPVCP
jgi:hypothetical protein